MSFTLSIEFGAPLNKTIEPLSWSVGGDGGFGSNSGRSDGMRPTAHSSSFTKFSDDLSAELFRIAVLGTSIGTVIVRFKGSDKNIALVVTMTDTRLDSYQVSGSSGDDNKLTETISMSFTKIVYEYKN